MLFQGFVISDWQGIDRITSPPHANYTYSIIAGITAGIDMVSSILFDTICVVDSLKYIMVTILFIFFHHR